MLQQNRILSRLLTGAILALGLLLSGTGPASASKLVFIGTGGVTGVYYPTGGAICRLLNTERRVHGVRCAVESTGGSVYNIINVLNGDLDFGIAQTDVQWKAVNGKGKFTEKAEKLRSVFSIHSETAALVVRADSGITRASEIKGRKINLGNIGSGQRETSQDVLKVLNLTEADLKLAGDISSSDQGVALADGRIDGFFYMVGHPNEGMKDIFYMVKARLIPLSGPGFEQLVKENNYYVNSKTPGGIYRGVSEDVPTFAVKATLVTSSNVPDEIVYLVVKSVFSDLERFKALHPAYANLTAKSMLEGLSAPLHPGALRYYKEHGLK
ncbi:MAG: TAXI family TRAP transporter solute-binding subunit [Deltaproteobacteria bacterium]|nr:TAXI family TRAP transporter solute-binding subunit [Deltaproteobacteria bacterium]